MNNVYMGLDVEDFIFGEGTTYEENIDNVTEEDMNRFGVIECVDEPDVACYRIALENEQNYSAIMMAMMNKEYQVLESTGSEMVYEAVDVKHYMDLVKAQIQKWWAKIKGVFKKLVDKITSFVGSNKAFVKRFRPRVGEMTKAGADFTGWSFHPNLGSAINYAAVASYLADAADMLPENTEKDNKILDGVRGKLIGKDDLNANEFSKLLQKHLHNEKENTEVIKSSGLEHLLNELEKAPTARKDAMAAHKEVEKTVKKLLSEVNKQKSKAEGEKAAGLRRFGTAISQSLNVMSTACNAQVVAIMQKMLQDRKAANAIVAANGKKEKTTVQHNSASFGEEFDVVLI